jgi:hypothetical protein
MLLSSSKYIAVFLSITTKEASAGTETVEHISVAVPPIAAAEYRDTVISALLVPSTLETIRELILNTLPLEAALLTTDVADVVVKLTTAVLPVIVLTLTMFGAAMFTP